MFCDNMSVIVFILNIKFYFRTRYIEVLYYFIRYFVLTGQVVVQYVYIQSNLADILIKGFFKERYYSFTE